MPSLVNNVLKSELDRLSSVKRIWVAYSGGVDSHVLLHALIQLQPKYGFEVRAIHVNHGLNLKADAWELHCITVCCSLGIACHALKVDVKSQPKESLEETARIARYTALKTCMHNGDYVVTGHHADDQAETFLLQLLRGAGTKGLSAMPILSVFDKGFLFRPLLSLPQSVLKTYAISQNLQWIEDESNMQVNFDRNYMRHHVIPALKSRWPHFVGSVYQSAKHCAESEALIHELAIEDFKRTEENGKLNLLKLSKLTRIRRHHALRYWLKEQGFPTPSRVHFAQFEKQFIGTRQDANPKLRWSTVQLRRYQNDLYALPNSYLESFSDCLAWNLQSTLNLPGTLGSLAAKEKLGQGLSHSALKDQKTIEVRFRQGGEKLCMEHTQRLKKRFQDWKIPPWERGRIPLIYIDGELAQIVMHSESYTLPRFAAKEDEIGLVVVKSCNFYDG